MSIIFLKDLTEHLKHINMIHDLIFFSLLKQVT